MEGASRRGHGIKSVLTHTKSGRRTTYGKVAEVAAKQVPKTSRLRIRSWKIAGKPLKRLDTADKVVGR
jgi:isoquinoline 1-oxidoreductase beta subunit